MHACELLVAAGANLNIQRSKDGMTALMLACANDHMKIADLLTRSNADFEIMDNKGKTAEDYLPGRLSDVGTVSSSGN